MDILGFRGSVRLCFYLKKNKVIVYQTRLKSLMLNIVDSCDWEGQNNTIINLYFMGGITYQIEMPLMLNTKGATD